MKLQHCVACRPGYGKEGNAIMVFLLWKEAKNITLYDSPRTSPAAPPFIHKQPSIQNRD